MDRICDLCVKTMIAAESEITPKLHTSTNYRTNCYELFGCDVILDADLNPSLLEVNVSPSLMGSSPLDKKIKVAIYFIIFLVCNTSVQVFLRLYLFSSIIAPPPSMLLAHIIYRIESFLETL
jgi:hypothetical protein